MYLASISALERLEERLVTGSTAPCFISFSTASAGLAQPQLVTDDDVQVGCDAVLLPSCLVIASQVHYHLHHQHVMPCGP